MKKIILFLIILLFNISYSEVLIGDMGTHNVYLVSVNGDTTHSWKTELPLKLVAMSYLDSCILISVDEDRTVPRERIKNGKLQILDWESNVIWSYSPNTEQYSQHHDLEVLSNGNIMMILYDVKTIDEAIYRGRNPELLIDSNLWSEKLVEIKPVGKDSVEIVWEWSVWDNIIQDFNSLLPNYGVIKDNPDKINLNYPYDGRRVGKDDWLHFNSISYNEDKKQIAVSSNRFGELYIIDYDTKKIIFRWGNLLARGLGDSTDQRLFGVHDVSWVGDTLIMFNNGFERPDGEYSTIEKVIYTSFDNWESKTIYMDSLFSKFMSGVEQIANDTYLVTLGMSGEVYLIKNGKYTILYDSIFKVFKAKTFIKGEL